MTTETADAARVVVIGAGMAGARLAARMPGVTVIGEETHAPYNRVLLAEVLAGRYAAEVIGLPPAEVRRGVRVVRIDRADRLVHCDDGSVVRYGRLVLATGSNPVLPPLRGLGTEMPDGVHAFRTLDDCFALREAVRAGTRSARAVVIGGGLLGVSAARALAACGAQVVLAQQGEHLMERQLDAESAGLLRRHLESLGVEVHTECRVRGLRCADGAVRAVELADGYELAAEITVLACGVRPRTGLAQAAAWTYAGASSSTTGCVPPTRTSMQSATAPSIAAPCTAWRARRWSRPMCSPRCWPDGPPATRGPAP